jgi:hypothetical protein
MQIERAKRSAGELLAEMKSKFAGTGGAREARDQDDGSMWLRPSVELEPRASRVEHHLHHLDRRFMGRSMVAAQLRMLARPVGVFVGALRQVEESVERRTRFLQ